MASILCPSCQNVNQEGRTVCWYCGTPLPVTQFVSAPAALELAPEPAFKDPVREQMRATAMQRMRESGAAWGSMWIMCPTCGVRQDYKRIRCLQCGSELTRNPWVCGVCGNENKREAHFCVFCHEPSGPIPAAENAPEPDAQAPERDTLKPQKFDFQTGETLFVPELVQRPGWFRCPSCSKDLHMGENKLPKQILKACPSCGAKFAIKEWICPHCLQLNPVAAEQCCFCGMNSTPAGRSAAKAAYGKLLEHADRTAGTETVYSSKAVTNAIKASWSPPATGLTITVSIIVLLMGLLAVYFMSSLLGDEDLFYSYLRGSHYPLYIILLYLGTLCLIPLCGKKIGSKRVYAKGAKVPAFIGLILSSVGILYVFIELMLLYAQFHDFGAALEILFH